MRFELKAILGLEVVALKAFRTKKTVALEVKYIMFSDKKTYIELEDQDYYTYHDCSESARLLELYQDPKRWLDIMTDSECYPDANTDKDFM